MVNGRKSIETCEGAANLGCSLGIVILDYNQQALTKRLLESIAMSRRIPDVIVIVENGDQATESETSPIASLTSLHVMRPGKNLGCAGGRNLGLSFLFDETPVTVFVLLDNDTVVNSSFCGRVCEIASQDSDVFAPVIHHYKSDAIWSCGGTVNRDNGNVSQCTHLPLQKDLTVAVDWSPGACLIIPRNVWAAVGTFDTWLDFMFEDIDWCLRVAQLGKKVRVATSILLDHEAHQSLGGAAASTSRTRLWARNGTVFRTSVLHCKTRYTLAWLCREMFTCICDFGRLRFDMASARASGLIDGLLESRRRANAKLQT